ncbi:TPA: hypothetical protein ACH3X1_011930 [Trebouxia sp. C0004]
MQGYLGGAGSLPGVPWEPVQLQGEWGLLQHQLAQTEAALRAEQHSCELLRKEAEESKGCAVQAKVQLEISYSKAERLAALVNQANQQRRGQQLACRALQRRMLHAWAEVAHHSRHESLLTAAAHDLACHHRLRHAWGRWTSATALAHGAALCLAHQKQNRVSAAFQAWRLFVSEAMQTYSTEPEADAVASNHARTAVLRRACSVWQAWLHEEQRPKAAAAQRVQQHHQAVCKIHALQTWQLSAAAAARKRLLLCTAEAHHGSRSRANSWQLWKAYTDFKALSHKQQRHAAVVHKHHMLWRCWHGWQAFMHVRWRKRAQVNTAMRHEHNSLTWRTFSSWQRQWRAYHCWLNLQQQRRLKHHLLGWHANALLHQHWRQLSRQADRLQQRHFRARLQQLLHTWKCTAKGQQQAKSRAVRAQNGMRHFGLHRILLAWYYCIHNLKLRRLHVQLADRQSSLLETHQQAQQAGRAVHELQLERAQLHHRLERVADHAKVQVGQLAVANDKMQEWQQRDTDHQLTLGECERLKAACVAANMQLATERNSCRQLEVELAEAKAAGASAAAAAGQSQEELQITCVSLQHHLAKRKARMDACLKILQATGHKSGDHTAEFTSPPELDVLLQHTLQHHAHAEWTLQERVQQQQTDLQALHHGLADSTRQQQDQQSCLDQMQARLQQAENLIQKQRLTIDKLYSQQGKNSRHPVLNGHMRQSENEYWRSWLQSSADCSAVNDRQDQQEGPVQQGLGFSAPDCPISTCLAGNNMQAVMNQTAQVNAPHVAGCSAPHAGRNSVACSSANSSRNARQNHQKQKCHQATPLSSNVSLVNVLHEDSCPHSGCHSCGWKPGSSLDNTQGVCALRLCSNDPANCVTCVLDLSTVA